MADDSLPIGETPASPLKPRFKGDRGKGADVPLEGVTRPTDISPLTPTIPEIQRPGGPMPTIKQYTPPAVTPVAESLPPLTGDPSRDLAAPTGPLSFEKPATSPQEMTSQGRQGLGRILLGPGTKEALESGAVGPGSSILRAIGVSEPTVQGLGRMGQALQQTLAMPWSQVPGMAGLGIRALQGGLLGGTEAALSKKPEEIPQGIGLGTALQSGTEAALSPLSLLAKNLVGNRILRNAAQKTKFDTAMTDTLNQIEAAAHKQEVQGLKAQYAENTRQSKYQYDLQKQQAKIAHEGQVAAQAAEQAAKTRAHSEQAAESIADAFKAQVPAWKDYPSDTKGLLDMVYGKGPQAVSEQFDQAMKSAVETAKGKMIQVPVEDIKALGLKPQADPLAGLSPAAREALVRAGKIPAGGGPLNPTGAVDAADVLSAVIGKWRNDPGLYRRVMGVLDQAGIGDPKARAEYKSAQALINYVDKTGALRGEVLNAEKVLGGFTKTKTVNELRRRGQGDIFEGPMQAARGGPLAPPEIPKPVIPPYFPPARPTLPLAPTPRSVPTQPTPADLGVGISRFTAPSIGATLGHVLGYGLGGSLGHPWMGSMAGGSLGAAAGKAAFPQGVITNAPLSPELSRALRISPSILAALIRGGLKEPNSNP